MEAARLSVRAGGRAQRRPRLPTGVRAREELDLRRRPVPVVPGRRGALRGGHASQRRSAGDDRRAPHPRSQRGVLRAAPPAGAVGAGGPTGEVRRPVRDLRSGERGRYAGLRARQDGRDRRRVGGGGFGQPQPAVMDTRLGAFVRGAGRTTRCPGTERPGRAGRRSESVRPGPASHPAPGASPGGRRRHAGRPTPVVHACEAGGRCPGRLAPRRGSRPSTSRPIAEPPSARRALVGAVVDASGVSGGGGS
jgi:hypothetical protein